MHGVRGNRSGAELGSLVVFDDLHFIANRLPDGSLCTFFVEPGDRRRGHWILHGSPYSPDLRAALLDAAADAGHVARDGGTYGHVDGPRFNTPSEIAQLAGCGVVAVSQTAGPETVLCGELELPFALMGFVTDYANEVVPGEPTPVPRLIEVWATARVCLLTSSAGRCRASLTTHPLRQVRYTASKTPPTPTGGHREWQGRTAGLRISLIRTLEGSSGRCETAWPF